MRIIQLFIKKEKKEENLYTQLEIPAMNLIYLYPDGLKKV